jgi:hypothetical protein
LAVDDEIEEGDDENEEEDKGIPVDDEAQEVVEHKGKPRVIQAKIVVEDVVVGKKEKRKVKVKRLPLHRLATQDIFAVGTAKIIAIDLPATSHRAKQRRKKERVALHDNLRSFLDNIGSNFAVE